MKKQQIGLVTTPLQNPKPNPTAATTPQNHTHLAPGEGVISVLDITSLQVFAPDAVRARLQERLGIVGEWHLHRVSGVVSCLWWVGWGE